MDLRQLEMFRAVVENSSFTVAGERLHVAQSAISRKVRLLEEELGEKLFKRANKRIFLTPAGETMMRYTNRVFQELHNAVVEISDAAGMKRGMLRIGSGMTACMYLLPPVIEELQKRFPHIDIQVITGTAEKLISQIRNSQIDVGVLTLPIGSQDLEVTPFTKEEMVLVASPRNRRLAKRRTVRAAELANFPMIFFSRGTSTRSLVDQYFERLGIAPEIAMESENVATIKPLVRINLGVSLLPLPCVIAEARRGELHYMRIRDERIVREIGLVCHKANYKPKALSELIALFRKRAANPSHS
ncbi:MAG: cmpR 2 [Bryobacterales bacterium]|nr:cmpR 2 [Bryobacterales bacterium]